MNKISYFDLGRNVTYIGVDAIRQILENTYELVLPANLEEFPDEEERKKIGMYTHKFNTEYKKLTIPSYVKYVHPFFIDLIFINKLSFNLNQIYNDYYCKLLYSY